MRSHIPRAWPAAAGAAVLLAFLSACVARGDTVSHNSRSFPFLGRRLTIEMHETNLIVESDTRREITAERELRGTAAQDGNATWSLHGDTLTIRVDCSGLVLSCESEHRVRIPEDVELTVTGTGGAVQLKGLTGDVTARLGHDGTLRVVRPAGRLRLYSTGGDITVTDARSARVQAMTSGDGNIDLGFAAPPTRVEVRAAGSVGITLPPGGETYRIDAPGSDVPSDPGSDRVIVAHAADGAVTIRKGR